MGLRPSVVTFRRICAVGACAKGPQRREGRKEKSKGQDARGNHHSMTYPQVAGTWLSLRPSRLCGLLGLRSIAWIRLRGHGSARHDLSQDGGAARAGRTRDIAGLTQQGLVREDGEGQGFLGSVGNAEILMCQ